MRKPEENLHYGIENAFNIRKNSDIVIQFYSAKLYNIKKREDKDNCLEIPNQGSTHNGSQTFQILVNPDE